MVAPAVPGAKYIIHTSHVQLINVSTHDIEAHYGLSDQVLWFPEEAVRRVPTSSFALARPVRWMPFALNTDEQSLVYYCQLLKECRGGSVTNNVLQSSR